MYRAALFFILSGCCWAEEIKLTPEDLRPVPAVEIAIVKKAAEGYLQELQKESRTKLWMEVTDYGVIYYDYTSKELEAFKAQAALTVSQISAAPTKDFFLNLAFRSRRFVLISNKEAKDRFISALYEGRTDLKDVKNLGKAKESWWVELPEFDLIQVDGSTDLAPYIIGNSIIKNVVGDPEKTPGWIDFGFGAFVKYVVTKKDGPRPHENVPALPPQKLKWTELVKANASPGWEFQLGKKMDGLSDYDFATWRSACAYLYLSNPKFFCVMLKRIKNGEAWKDALEGAYQKSIEKLEQDWIRWAQVNG